MNVLTESNIITQLTAHEAHLSPTVPCFGSMDDALASLVANTVWRLHPRLETYGIDRTLRHAWTRRHATRRSWRGRADVGKKVSWDAWQLILSQARPQCVLMLSMTCRGLRDQIRADHTLWCRLFVRWEYRAQARRTFPNFIAPHTPPPGIPRGGWTPSDVRDKGQFNASIHKLVAMEYTPCCGVCGQKRRKTDAVWVLGVRVCTNCWHGNLVSSNVLYHRYGIRLTEPLPQGGATSFIERCFDGVFFFIHKVCNRFSLRYRIVSPLRGLSVSTLCRDPTRVGSGTRATRGTTR